MPTCLVTGGAGFLGSHLCDELLRRGNRVICVDNVETGSLANIEHIRVPEFVHLNLDITEPYFIDEPVDCVYHLASPASPIDYLRLPLHTLKVGSYGTHHTLGVAKIHRARFLLASTSEVYGDPQVHPQPESYWGHVNPIGPRGVYDEAKRYAEALTMAYHRQQGVDTAIVRIFNSVLADEQVLYDDGRELRREPVAALASRLARNAVPAAFSAAAHGTIEHQTGTHPQPAVEYPLEGFTVPAFDDHARLSAVPAVSLIGHPTSEPCFEVRTRYGRSIRVTGDHSIFVEGPGGRPEARLVSDLQVGDRVAIARRIEVPERDHDAVDMVDVWRHADRDPWDLLIEAPGLGARVWEKRHDVFGLLVSERRNKGPNWRNGAWTKIIRMRASDRVPLPVLRRLDREIPRQALVRQRVAGRSVPMPARVAISDELLWLLGLWVAEGCWHQSPGNAFINISCEEGLLDRAQRIVEGELGLHVVRSPATDARSSSLFVHSRLLLHLLERLGLGPGPKRIPGWILGLPLSRLKWFIEGYRQGDGVHSGARYEAGERHEFTTVDTGLKDDLIVAFARFGLVPSVDRYQARIKARSEDRRYPFWRLTLCQVSPWSPLEWDAGTTQKLNARVSGDLVWAAVTAIEPVAPTPLVYDFSVPGAENFWAGSGVMAHNTYGPRMRPHDGRAIPTFLRQALANRPLTVFGDGEQTRSFCYVSDLIRGLIGLSESGHHTPVNIGNPDEYTLLELAKVVIEVTGSSSEIVFEALPTDDPHVRQPDTTLAQRILSWAPEVSLREGLARTIDEAGHDALIGLGPR
ncbi:MAG TPA: NAD-dependent epimerase/dehydratase family protein [Solirubrobacteraceae bacterium]|jgi:nucleoside-diphosphate-sugar epimerase/intein/homing endonuclease|nr:NAD-dependent epimerase/dehydratase family protein [Solirubrobacteraceae bacterium]